MSSTPSTADSNAAIESLRDRGERHPDQHFVVALDSCRIDHRHVADDDAGLFELLHAAQAGIGYSFVSPRNPFWRLLHESGLTPFQLAPCEEHLGTSSCWARPPVVSASSMFTTNAVPLGASIDTADTSPSGDMCGAGTSLSTMKASVIPAWLDQTEAVSSSLLVVVAGSLRSVVVVGSGVEVVEAFVAAGSKITLTAVFDLFADEADEADPPESELHAANPSTITGSSPRRNITLLPVTES
jgi:hypothetical protein